MANQYDFFNLMKAGGYNPMDGGITTNQMQDFRLQGLINNMNQTNEKVDALNLPPVQEPNPQAELLKKQQRGNMLMALGDLLSGRDASSGFMQRKAGFDAQKERAERQAKQEEMLASMSPETRKVYEMFGPNAAFQYQQQQLAAEAAGLQELKTRQGLIDAGFSDREINLFTNAGMKAKDIIELRDVEPDNFKSLETLNKEINQEYVSSKGLESIDQAFSFKDTIDNAVNKAVGPILGTPAKETNAAINSKGILNENLRERFVNQYSGRPSVYLNQRIDALLPMGTYISEFDAMQKYQEIKRVLDQGKAELEENINSGMFEGADLLTLQNEYKSTSFLIKDLETVIGNLKGDEQTNIDVVDDDKNIQRFGQFGTFFGVEE